MPHNVTIGQTEYDRDISGMMDKDKSLLTEKKSSSRRSKSKHKKSQKPYRDDIMSGVVMKKDKKKKKHKDVGPSYGSQEQPQGHKGGEDSESEVDVGMQLKNQQEYLSGLTSS